MSELRSEPAAAGASHRERPGDTRSALVRPGRSEGTLGRSAPLTRRTAVWLGVDAVVLTAVLIGLGLALTHLSGAGPLSRQDLRIDHWFGAHRSSLLNTLTVFGSGSANTQTAIAVAALSFVGLRWWLGRWFESWAVLTAILGELLIFLVVTAVVHRPRPTVARLDIAPPTSSFPSGHTAAAVALYGCLAVIVWRCTHRATAGRAVAVTAVCTLLWLLPVCVGVSRLYRGMHYPSDVVAGAVGGGLWLLAVLIVLRPGRVRGGG